MSCQKPDVPVEAQTAEQGLISEVFSPPPDPGDIDTRAFALQNPTLFSEAWAANWRAAIAKGDDPLAKYLADRADPARTRSKWDPDKGLFGTMMYRITGDEAYADSAYRVVREQFSTVSQNEARETTTEKALIYFGLRPYLSKPANAAKRADLIARMNAWCDAHLSYIGERRSDSDLTTGSLGVLLWSIVSAPENARAAEFANAPVLGGLTPTGLNHDNTRNAVARFIALAKGGEFIESAMYNLGTMTLLILATEGIRAAAGVDHFPEAAAFYQRAALAEVQKVTPDRKQAFEWGDLENPRSWSAQLPHRLIINGMLAGLTQGNASVGPQAQKFFLDLFKDNSPVYMTGSHPWGRLFLLFNPQAPTADWRALPKAHDARGMGMTFFREGWNEQDAFVGIYNRNPLSVDHEQPSFTEVQLYRKGEWVLTDPLMYDGRAISDNTVLLAGVGGMAEGIGRTRAEIGANDSHVYSVATTAGSYFENNEYQPGAKFVNEASRALLYLPSSDGKSATLVIHDRINATKPTGESEHLQGRWAEMLTAPVKQIVFHTPVSSTITPSSNGDVQSFAWSTPGGQQVTVRTLTPGWKASDIAITESLTHGYYQEEELKRATILTPRSERKWDTSLTVVTATDAGYTVSAERFTSGDGALEGAVIRRAGSDDAVVLFNAAAGADLPPDEWNGDRLRWKSNTLAVASAARVRKLPFSITFTTQTAKSLVTLTDLDPTQSWRVKASANAQPVALPVSSQGVARLSLSGVGAQTLWVETGTAETQPPPETPPMPPPATGPTMPPISQQPPPPSSGIQRGESFMGTPERFNRFYTDGAWRPTKVYEVSSSATLAAALSAVQPGEEVFFKAGTYDNICIEVPRSGTPDAPILFRAERGPNDSRGVRLNCCTTGRGACFNIESKNDIAIEGFNLVGGIVAVRAVGSPGAHAKGVAMINNDGWGQSRDTFFTGFADWTVFDGNRGHDSGTNNSHHAIYASNGSDWNIIRNNELFATYSDLQVNPDPVGWCLDENVPYDDARCDGVANATASGLNGEGASDFFLVEGNYVHDGKGNGANFTSMRRSIVRGNVFSLPARHNVSFWQETDNPRLGARDNVIHNNFFVGKTSHVLQLINHSTNNEIRNNIVAGVTAQGTANAGVQLLDVDDTVTENSYLGNVYLSGTLPWTVTCSEQRYTDFSTAWFQQFPTNGARVPMSGFEMSSTAPFAAFAVGP